MWRYFTPQVSYQSKEFATFLNLSHRLSEIQSTTKAAGALSIENKWRNHLLSIREDLDKTVAFTLLRNIPNMTFETIFEDIGPSVGDTIRYCSNAGSKCGTITQLHYGNFPKCFNYETAQNNRGRTLSNEGITRGVTMVLNTGVQLTSVALQRRLLEEQEAFVPPPIFQNNFYPFAANGIRLMINSPGVMPNMDKEGINIIPGHSTLIAVSGKEITRLSSPYSDCTNTDYEMKMLRENVSQSLGFRLSLLDGDDGMSTYTQQQCRTACLQREIWGKCKCLDSFLDLPFKNLDSSVLCSNPAKTEMNIFLKPESYNKSHCFRNLTDLISDGCRFLHKMINDLVCVKEVKEKYEERKMSGESECRCPPACHSYQYDMTISQALWPAAGIETQEVYYNLLEKDNFKQEKSYVFKPNQTDETGLFCPYSLQKGASADKMNGSGEFQDLRLV